MPDDPTSIGPTSTCPGPDPGGLAGKTHAPLSGTGRDVELRMFDRPIGSSEQYAQRQMANALPIRPTKYPGNGRRELLEFALSQAEGDGFYAEFGVFKGASLSFIADRIDRVVYGFDSFEGLPEDWSPQHPKGTFSLNGEVPKIGSSNHNYRIVKGWFKDSVPFFAEQIKGDAAFLNMDCHLYVSVRDVLDNLGDRVVAGTVILFCEYINYVGWERQQFRAFQEFCGRRNLKYRYLAYGPLCPGVTVIIE